MDNDVIVVGANRKKAVFLLFAALAFVAMGVAMIVNGEHVLAGWACALFFGLGIPLSIYRLTPGAGELKIDRQGIEIKTLFKPMTLAWADVNAFYVGSVTTGSSNTKMIGIEYSPSYTKLAIGRRISASLTGMQGAIPNSFNRSAEEVCALLNHAKQEWG
jgi:hypothetical protein